MQDKKVIDLTSLIERKPEGHFGWIIDRMFDDREAVLTSMGTEEQREAIQATRRIARLLGDTLIDMLNTNEFRDKNRRIKIKVAGPKAPKQLAADEMSPAQAQELFAELAEANKGVKSVLEGITANGDKLHLVLERMDFQPTDGSLRAGLTQLNQKVDGHTDRKIEELSQKIENWSQNVREAILVAISEYAAGEQPEATPLPINTTMSGKGVFWYNDSTHTICEGAARPAGGGWARLVPAPESMESPAHTSDEAWRQYRAAQAKETLEEQFAELKKATHAAAAEAKVPPSALPDPDRPLNFQGMPKDVNDRINRNLKRQATVRRTLSVPVEAPTGPADVEKVLTMGVGLSQINLNSLREDHDQLVRYLKRDIEKITEKLDLGLDAVDRHELAKGMLDNAGQFAASLNRWKEAVDHLGKHAAELSSESGALRKELGL